MKESVEAAVITIEVLDLLAQKVYDAMSLSKKALLADVRTSGNRHEEREQDKARNDARIVYLRVMDDYLDAVTIALKQVEPGSAAARELLTHRALFLSKTVGFEENYGKVTNVVTTLIEDWFQSRTEEQLRKYHYRLLVASLVFGFTIKATLGHLTIVGAVGTTLIAFTVSHLWRALLTNAARKKINTGVRAFFTNQKNIDKHEKQLHEALDTYDDGKREASKAKIASAMARRNRSLVGQKIGITLSGMALSFITGGLTLAFAGQIGIHDVVSRVPMSKA